MDGRRGSRWLAQDEEFPTRLRIWNLSRLGRWSLAAAIPGYLALALPESGWRLVELSIFTILTGTYLCRFAWTYVEADASGVTYRDVLRIRRWHWAEVDGVVSAANGVGLLRDSAVVWLMPTKTTSWRTRHIEDRADTLWRRLVSYAPDAERFQVEVPEPQSNVRRIRRPRMR